ncbi:MAG TPA: hypothetical protein PLL53_03755 [Saprospiraceae bacterium]|nr:hypothetical protein [Saprospiraceae bacterium]
MDDCIEILGNALMRNFGTLELVAQDSAGTGNNSIAVGTDVIAGNFVNEASGIITASGGAKEAGRAISVNALGVFTNRGNVTLSGFPGAGARLYNRGQSLNDLGGVLNLGDGRANLNTGSLTNSGLIKSVREGSGIFTATGSQAINNGFFNYNMSGQFAAGMGTTTNNGIDLNNAAQTTINAGGACSVDIAQAPYAWFQGATQVAIANDEGLLTFPAMSLTADPVQLSNGIPGVVITVQNVCPAALMTSSVFSPVTATALRLYPSLLRGESELTVEMPESVQSQSITFEVAGMDGRVLRRETTAPGRLRSLRTDGLQPGLYFVRAQSDHLYFLGKFVLID